MNIVIPMAGNGSRFVSAGYSRPKPFIEVFGKSMIERVMENIYMKGNKYYLVAKPEHLETEPELVKQIEAKYNATFIPLDSNQTTEGAACTVLHARKYINNSDPLMFANSDQLVDFSVSDFIDDLFIRKLDSSILIFENLKKDPKWSFVKKNEEGFVTAVAEKNPISSFATVGLYLFRKGSFFVDAALDMIVRNDRCKNEFYVCPAYNYLIKNGLSVGTFSIAEENMYGLGTPEDLSQFVNSKSNFSFLIQSKG